MFEKLRSIFTKKEKNVIPVAKIQPDTMKIQFSKTKERKESSWSSNDGSVNYTFTDTSDYGSDCSSSSDSSSCSDD